MTELTKKELNSLDSNLRETHDANGSCRSCGWHAAFYEMYYEPTGNMIDGQHELWDLCKSESEDSSHHRGCFIYIRDNDDGL